MPTDKLQSLLHGPASPLKFANVAATALRLRSGVPKAVALTVRALFSADGQINKSKADLLSKMKTNDARGPGSHS